MTTPPPSSVPPAGWFPDPQVQGQLRYWDGQRWSEHTAPLHPHRPTGGPAPDRGPAAAAPARRAWPVRHPVLTCGAAALLALVVGAGVADSGGEDDSIRPSAGSTSEAATSPDLTDAEEVEPAVDPSPEPPPPDTDGDGVEDSLDVAPTDPSIRTADDLDTDGDGVPDGQDDFPDDPAFSKDTDGDGVADRLDAFPTDERYSKDSDGDKVADSVDAFPQDPSRSEITLAMSNALEEAENYLDYSAFSRQGLIDQLSSEYGSGFEVADATWAVGQLDVDWKEQAVREAKQYLDYSSFSRQGLIDQLSSPYGSQFTLEEATYAVDKIGL